jgi:hypothetical protein
MRSSDIPSGAQRDVNAGHVWEEKLTAAQGTLELLPQQTFRVRGGAGTTVTIAGVLAMTMVTAGEIEYFNAGTGAPGDNKTTVTVSIAGANAHVQVARQTERGRRNK